MTQRQVDQNVSFLVFISEVTIRYLLVPLSLLFLLLQRPVPCILYRLKVIHALRLLYNGQQRFRSLGDAVKRKR